MVSPTFVGLPLDGDARSNAVTKVGGEMTVFTLGPSENEVGPFAEVQAQHELDARRKVQSVDDRRNWLDLNATYCMPIGAVATRYISVGEVRIYEKFEDLPPA
jgi:hypothetical protein